MQNNIKAYLNDGKTDLFKALREPLKIVYKFMSFSKGAPPTIFKEMEQFEEDIQQTGK